MSAPSNLGGGGGGSGFDTNLGFTVTNLTNQNIYLQTSDTAFEQISPNLASTPQTVYRNYDVRSNNTTTAPIYLTVQVSSSDGSVNVVSGTIKGNVLVTTYFA
ncbi:hypothetical protein GALMADRAFT_155485 [Galerina marginata CBS 339.88]|uniref:Uncharacterized protein n=1 Tax=Galerina marginata (strain CBS 339.88) TaxID=685588 RepID=A0A067T3B2_GALM3|nr:hypothetical protein GALMADRAFT_155485 [Galerina marginata CBS 339.88]